MIRALLIAALATGAPMAAGAQTYVVLMTGLAGEPVYATRFHEWASTLRSAVRGLGVPDSQLIYLGQDPALDPAIISGPATKERLETTLRRLASQTGPGATIVLALFGHGSDRGEPRLSLPGPDLSATGLASLLDAFPSQRVVVVNAASASGGFVPVLAGPRRIVITATKSGFEQNHALFGGFFAEAFATMDADLDKDERVSVLEAFLHARAAVARAYDTDRRLLTEHALLDDDGDGEGTGDPSTSGKDGSLAAATFLGQAAAVVAGDSATAALERRRATLETEIAALRNRRDAMPADAYERELETLLVELAEVTRALRARSQGGPPP